MCRMVSIGVATLFFKSDDLRLTRNSNSSGDEIANVNFLYDDIVHVLQNTIDSCINSATDGRGCYADLIQPNPL